MSLGKTLIGQASVPLERGWDAVVCQPVSCSHDPRDIWNFRAVSMVVMQAMLVVRENVDDAALRDHPPGALTDHA